MALGTITNQIALPGLSPSSGIPVIARLKPSGGFSVGGTPEITDDVRVPPYVPTAQTITDSGGNWSHNLVCTTDVLPSGTYYEITEQIPDSQGGARVWAVQCATGTNTLFASLVTPPPTVQSAVYLTQASADARYPTLGTLGGALGSTAGGATPAYLAGLGLTAAEADYGSTNGQGVAGQSRTTNGILCPSQGLSGSGGLNGGVFADPNPARNGIGANYSILGQIDNTTGAAAVTVAKGGCRMLFFDSTAGTYHQPGVQWQEAMSPVSAPILVPAGEARQVTTMGQAAYIGTNPPTNFGEAQVILAGTSQTALIQVISTVSYVPLLRGPNPGSNIPTSNQIWE